ncbi:MAG: bifunctional folylpolyglutamate synthase/dihydrofolate synthase [Candidatus Tectomicrobia bacterium]|uniref:Dihydrofolate synthase/folylpolyglutamate synthase n=1 Tax=Tectimicrobiota bacterium TaxID=2528274 RepID=A0A932CQS3_UNCTE|nr:bifunctional folylpolyglutamate synthase/dihydrofolate synthase [Candidatus Tectomicrobia bacterium]
MIYPPELAYLSQLSRFGMRLGLERTERLLEQLGAPHRGLRAIHIAGTNGKGSTAAMTSSILRAAGYRVGLYTSPHLMEVRERIRIDGESISEERLAALIGRIRSGLFSGGGREEVTYFEFLTVLALTCFQEERVDLAVVETGLGGRLDATNVITPLVSAITRIDSDHTEHLGSDLVEIAREKAGIIKPGIPVVSSEQRAEVASCLEEVCRAHGVQLILQGRDFRGEILSSDREGVRFHFSGSRGRLQGLRTPLLGRHQAENAATALAICQELGEEGFPCSEEAIRCGLERTCWRGRIEILSHDPLVIVDGAHNPAAISALQDALEELFPSKRKIMVFGVLKDKDYAKMLATLAPWAEKLVLTRPPIDRGADPTHVAEKLGLNFQQKGVIIKDAPAALDYARQCASAGDLVCVTGSLYLVAEALKLYGRSSHKIGYPGVLPACPEN